MTGLREFAKRYALRFLPAPVLQYLKRIHYAHVLGKISPAEEPDLAVVTHLVRSGDWVADIGANIGIYTKWLSDLVGPTGCVYSFEPIPETHDILISNVRKFKLHNVRLYCCALSDRAGVVEMGVPRSKSGGENYYQARVVSADALGVFRRVSAPLQSLDSILAESPQAISFVKCDVEEHELQCVQGAVRTTKRFHPAWSIELSSDPDNPYSNSAAVSRLFTENGYTAYWFDGRRLNQRCRGDSSVNYFFLTPQHLGPLQRAGLIG